MRYLLLTYYNKPDGTIDESMQVASKIKPKTLATASVILDFRTLSVIKCSVGSQVVPKDFNRILEYYMQYHESTITSLLNQNGYSIELRKTHNQTQPTESNPG